MPDETGAAGRRARPLLRLAACNAAVAALLALPAGGRNIAEIWYAADANSLVGLQAFVEQRLDPDELDPTLYFDYVLPALELPAWLGAFVALCLFDAIRLYAARAALSGAAWLRRRRGGG